MSEALSPLVAALLGLLQGATEFLPISSSGHLALAALFFKLPQSDLSLVITLHLGTLIATAYYVRSDLSTLLSELTSTPLLQLLGNPSGKLICQIGIACIPTAIIGYALRGVANHFMTSTWIIGLLMLFSSFWVGSTYFHRKNTRELNYAVAFAIGIVQGLAVLPGLSRSGSTIACALLFGISRTQAFRFSFLLSIPTILGALLLELLSNAPPSFNQSSALLGGCVALLSGYLALYLLQLVLKRRQFWLFSLYLLPVGLILIGASR